MEWLEVFDINENSLDKKILRGFKPDDNEYVMIVYVFIVNNGGKILLEENAKYTKWVVPGGHVGEKNPKDAIKRECMEELGIDIDVNSLKEINTLNNNNRLFKLFYLNFDIDINLINVQKEEVNKAKYFSIEEIDNLINEGTLRENNIIFIEELKKYLHK